MPIIYKPKKEKPKEGWYENQRRKIYNSQRWRHLRRIKFAMSPLCELCLKDNKVTPAEDIHHIVSFMSVSDPVQQYQLAYDVSNLMSLCKIHHQQIHNKK